LSEGLLIHYKFDGNAEDASENEYDGTESGVVYVSDRNGNPASACYFDGINDFIDLPNIPDLKPDLPVSFAFWVKFVDINAFNAVLFTTDFADSEHSGVWMNLSGTGKLVINFGDASGNTSSPNRRSKVGTSILEADKWYHVIGIARSALDMELYIDCENDEGEYSGSGGALAYTDNQGSIGRKDSDFTGPAHYFKGTIDDLRYWDRALTEDDILLICRDNETNSVIKEDPLNVIVYPNPTRNLLNITHNDSINLEQIILTDLSGKQIIKTEFQSKIDLSNLSKGTYLLIIKANDKIYQTKIVRY
jgi:hypothetical protein